LEVREARTPEEIEDALRLRELVFSGEQGIPSQADRDGRDEGALHLVAVDEGRVIGTCRLVFDGAVAKLGRLVVEKPRRGAGVGGSILRQAERSARDARAESIALHAQLPARDLYARQGFVDSGPSFMEEGIPHVAMEKRLVEP
jgi:predicted GNAT family N-acyltransferase